MSSTVPSMTFKKLVKTTEESSRIFTFLYNLEEQGNCLKIKFVFKREDDTPSTTLLVETNIDWIFIMDILPEAIKQHYTIDIEGTIELP